MFIHDSNINSYTYFKNLPRYLFKTHNYTHLLLINKNATVIPASQVSPKTKFTLKKLSECFINPSNNASN